MSENTRSTRSTGIIGFAASVLGTMIAAQAYTDAARVPTPTQNRITLAGKVQGMDYAQLHTIARYISEHRMSFNLSYREAGYVGLLPMEMNEVAYRTTVLTALGRCTDAQLTQLAVLIAGA